MKLDFTLETQAGSQPLHADIHNLIIAGWAGRDMDAIEHHIQELAEIGVPRPSAVPLFYRVASNQLVQDDVVQVVGDQSSGEVEAFVFTVDGVQYLSIASDHTDRKLEAYSVALSKQLCIKPVARTAWRLDEVIDYWDELQIRARIVENGEEVAYQDGTLASLRTVTDLVQRYNGGAALADGDGMTCGTVAVIGGIRPAVVFEMELYDPRRQRSIRHRYSLTILPEVA
ncbi:DUF2848 domain-containing protein [Pseudomonas matsuisoli]|uniref:DUF2848 domain-containing protein n=1 Tax=Pseudomonas matsuisoli TaxID=1515666 RepID=A0A917UZ40_9PSED|nr:DUF2848 domain-containing protein [Pseudomonas matsuisoli]GGJ98276.1 hypothetical protein GCM10009304_25270 [Pseudomonas matsuisoli]